MSNIPEEIRFGKNLMILLDVFVEAASSLSAAGIVTIDPNKIRFVSMFLESYNKHVLICNFIDNSHEVCWDKIKMKDETFFVENCDKIFKEVPGDTVKLVKNIYLSKDKNGKSIIRQDLKDSVWSILHAMIKISIKYVNSHGERFPYIDAEYHAKIWSLSI